MLTRLVGRRPTVRQKKLRQLRQNRASQLVWSLLLARLLHLDRHCQPDEMFARAVRAVLEVLGHIAKILVTEFAVQIFLEFRLGLVAAAIGHVVLLGDVESAGAEVAVAKPRSRA